MAIGENAVLLCSAKNYIMKKSIILLVLCFVYAFQSYSQEKKWIDFNRNGEMDLYENPDATVDNRVNDLLSRMTVDEKILLLREVSPAIPRLGIAKYDHGNEALHGIIRPGKFTVFPQAIAFASTWNPELIQRVSTAISDEARARWNELDQGRLQTKKFTDLLTFWSPTVNMARDPRWGRTPETYGEDCYLTSRIGVAFVKGLQGSHPRYLKVVSTPKHFAGNNEEHNRFQCKMEVSEQTLRSYYLPAFKALITEGKAESIMSAYNAINGVPCTANKWLLTDLLRNEWGFNGYVVSDCGAPGLLYSDHHYTANREEAAQKSLQAGLDLECGGYCPECFIYTDYLPKAYNKGLVTEAEIDKAAFRVLRARFKLGIFDDPSLNPYAQISPSVVGCKEHQELALETARQSIVLLKNTKNMLPLNKKKIKSLAVFGINAGVAEFGDYSGVPLNEPVSPLQGIKNKLADTKVDVRYVPWMPTPIRYETVDAEFFSFEKNGKTEKGLAVSYFPNTSFEGTPVESTDKWIHFDPANQPPNPIIPKGQISVRWSGNITVPVSGKYKVGLSTRGSAKFYMNDKLLLDLTKDSGDGVELDMVAGEKYPVKYEYVCDANRAYTALKWQLKEVSDKESFKKEKSIAKKSDVVIAVLGINKSIEREGRDRTSLDLPIDQMKFIQELYKANPKTVVVLVAGSSLTINWINQNVPAIIDAWYPGEQGGTAIADVLFGDYNPSGKLPMTFYNSIDDLPPFNDYEISKGRTYMYLTKTPLYPFGYGLSYTNFEISNMQIAKNKIQKNETLEVSVDVQNVGKREGAEVVQLYIHDKTTTDVKMPNKQLKRFERVYLNKGEKKTVHFTLTREDLSHWNQKNEYVLNPGSFELIVGNSSVNESARADFEVVEDEKENK